MTSILDFFFFLGKREKLEHTSSLAVKGSYPEPPEAKLKPVWRSLLCKFGNSWYEGNSSLIPIASAAKKKRWARVNVDEKLRSSERVK